MYGGWTIDPGREVTRRTFEYCHACGEERTQGDDHPWCNDECLQALSDAWWEEYRKIQATNQESDGGN